MPRYHHLQLMEEHGIELSYTWVKMALQGAGCSRLIGCLSTMLMINPQHARSRALQAHLVLETRSALRLILY